MGRVHRPHLARAVASLAALSAGGAGCADEPADPGLAWIESIRSPGDASACVAIDDADLAGECLAMAARELAGMGRAGDARALCSAMAEGPWRHECYFLLSDAAHSTGDEAHQLCGDAGRFRSQCMAHAMGRELHDLFEAAPRGEEDELFRSVARVVDRYETGPRVMARARLLMTNHLAGRDPDEPFGFAQCGNVAPDLCRAAYAERVRLAGRDSDGWQTLCPGPPSTDDVGRLELPTWDVSWQGQAMVAWADLCDGRAEPGRPAMKPSGG